MRSLWLALFTAARMKALGELLLAREMIRDDVGHPTNKTNAKR